MATSLKRGKSYWSLIEFYQNKDDPKLLNQIHILYFRHLVASKKLGAILSLQDELEYLRICDLQSDPDCIDIFLEIHQVFFQGFYQANLQLTNASKIHVLCPSEKELTLLLDQIFRKVMAVQEPVIKTQKKEKGFAEMSYVLFKQLGISIKEPEQIIQQVHPIVQKSLELLNIIMESPELKVISTAACLKKVMGYHLDRPSEYTIKSVVLPNVFLLRCVVLSQNKTVLRNVLQVVSKMQKPGSILNTLFPDMPADVRDRYVGYVVSRNIVDLRWFILQYPEYSNLVDIV